MGESQSDGDLSFVRGFEVRLISLFAVMMLTGLVAGCGITPASGPVAEEIDLNSSADPEHGYIVVDLDKNVIRTLNSFSKYGLGRRFKSKKAHLPKAEIGVGDVLSVTIWEAGEGGLFSNTDSKSVTLPQVVVNREGEISIPYAGLLKVSDMTPLDVQEEIVKKLEGRAIQPQAAVGIAKNESNTVVISGDVAKPGKYPLSLGGDRLLDVVASAGGSRFPADEMYVTFIRGKKAGTQLMKSIINDRDENIYVSAGDRVYLSHDPNRYTVFGAVETPGVYPFKGPDVNLLEAVAAAGGLQDARADATGLFIFRMERLDVAEAIAPGRAREFGAQVPVVYRVNMRDPLSYFYANGFKLRNKDVMFASNAKSVELGKIFVLLNLATGSVANIGRIVNP